jgi:hypothetical protein
MSGYPAAETGKNCSCICGMSAIHASRKMLLRFGPVVPCRHLPENALRFSAWWHAGTRRKLLLHFRHTRHPGGQKKREPGGSLKNMR